MHRTEWSVRVWIGFN